MSVGERYVELCLRIVRHDDELLDYFYGPKELADRVDAEPLREPARLAEDARALAGETDSEYLRAQLRGLELVARKLGGEQIPYAEEVESCYGVKPERVPEERFEEAHRGLDELLPPGASLAERHRRWQDGDPVPLDRLEAVLQTVGDRLQETTRDLFGLPDGETFELEFVKGEHWYAFNHYLGGLRSKMAVNTDLPTSPLGVVRLVAHELYPGHHTERVWKDELLHRADGRLEETVLTFGTPQSVITEGIAVLAVDMVVADHGSLLADAFAEEGIAYDPELSARILRVERPLESAIANAAILLHVDGASPEEAAAYLQRWELSSEERVRQHVEFVIDRWGAAYIRTYTDGYDLCRRWVAGDPARFKRLLTEQLTPADLA